MEWIAGAVLIAAFAGACIAAGLADRNSKGTACPFCGSRRKFYLWGDVWGCWDSGHAYAIVGITAEPLSSDDAWLVALNVTNLCDRFGALSDMESPIRVVVQTPEGSEEVAVVMREVRVLRGWAELVRRGVDVEGM